MNLTVFTPNFHQTCIKTSCFYLFLLSTWEKHLHKPPGINKTPINHGHKPTTSAHLEGTLILGGGRGRPRRQQGLTSEASSDGKMHSTWFSCNCSTSMRLKDHINHTVYHHMHINHVVGMVIVVWCECSRKMMKKGSVQVQVAFESIQLAIHIIKCAKIPTI